MPPLQDRPAAQGAPRLMREVPRPSHAELDSPLGTTARGARQTIHRARQNLRDGFGLLVTMPILKLLLGGAAAVPAGAAGGSTSGVAVGAAGGGGAAIGLKAAGAVLLVAGTVGTGVALKE